MDSRSKRNPFRLHIGAAACVMCGAALALTVGCDGKKPGPKREDHEIAHKAIYHPDIDRGREAPPPASQPAAEEVDLSSGTSTRRQQVLVVNGQTLIVADILEPIVEDLRTAAGKLPLSVYIRHAQREVLREIQSRISHIVVYQEAELAFEEEQFQKLFDSEAEETLLKLIRIRYDGARARLEKHLAEFDMTYDDAFRRARENSMAYSYLRRKFELIRKQPTRREIMRYYQTHTDEFTTPARAQPLLIEVMFKDEEGKPLADTASEQARQAARDRARQRARQALDELAAGMSFESVAKTYSDGIRASSGGVWDEVQPGGMVKRWAAACDALFKLQEGEISPLIETPVSFFIVKCGRIVPETMRSFEEAQADIVRKLQEEQFDDWSRDYIIDLVEQAHISSEDKLAFAAEVLFNCPRPLEEDRLSDAGTSTP